MPLVSVIIPNYNHAVYLHKRIDSVLNQTFTDFEVIILDDCSSDNSKAVINSYKGHPQVSHIVFNEVNSGSTFKQWEKGVGLASGQFIWIAESDDRADPYFLSKLVPVLMSDTNIAISFAQSFLINSKDEITVSALSSYPQDWKQDRLFTKEEALGAFSIQNPIINASSAVFRKSAVANIDFNFTKLKYCGDWLFWILIVKTGGLAYFIEELNYFRQHEKNVRTSNNFTCVEILEQLYIYRFLKNELKYQYTNKELDQFQQILSNQLYVKISLLKKGKKVLYFNRALMECLSTFPKLIVALPQVFVRKIFKQKNRPGKL